MRYFLTAALLLAAAPAFAEEAAQVRMGAHDGFGRVVFEFSAPTPFHLDRDGDSVVLHFSTTGDVPAGSGGTHNIASVTGGAGIATLSVAPGTKLRSMRLGNRVVVDVLDAAATTPPAAAKSASRGRPPAHPAEEHAAGALATTPASVVPPASAPSVAPPATAAKAAGPAPLPSVITPGVVVPGPAIPALSTPGAIAQPAPVIPVVRDPPPAPAAPTAEAASATPPVPAPAGSEPISLAASLAPLPPGETGSSALLPFDAAVGAAAFRHGSEAWVVFDQQRPLDLAALGNDPLLAGAAVQLLPQATLLRLKMPEGRALRLERQKDGWQLTLASKPSPVPPLVPVTKSSRLLLPTAGGGQVVVVADSATGQNLLVGTTLVAGGVPVAYRVPEFSIRPSWQGVVVDPISDRTQLRLVQGGFAIETGDTLAPAPASARALEDAAVLTRRFEFANEPVATLLRRLQLQVEDQSRAPAQTRLEPRKRAVQTMLSLGLGPEAQSLLKLATTEDPRALNDPDAAGLMGIASLMSDRPSEAGGLLNPALNGSDEVALWRAVRTTMLNPDAPEAAPVFAATMGLVLSYPAAMRNRLLPLAAETMATGGAASAADALLAKLPNEPLLALARAMRLEATGKSADALTVYDALAVGRDRLSSARAATRATLLRLATKAIGPGDAADALERQFLNWRGDGREEKLRLRAASLRAEAGQWRRAFSLLRETIQLFPDDTPKIDAMMTSLMNQLLHGPGASNLPPMELVSLAEENAELVGSADKTVAGLLLADKLTALDLPNRAGPIIERIMAAAPAGVGRASLGARLAKMRLDENDDAGAASALSGTDAPDLPAALIEERGLIDARIHARAHDVGGAAAILSAIDSNAADDLRATILSDASDWRGAVAALSSLAARSVPANGALTPVQQDTLLRLASAQAQAGDDASLRLLGMKEEGRMAGPRADMFHLLTAAPVSNVSDLKRSAGEVALARAVPAGLAAMGSH